VKNKILAPILLLAALAVSSAAFGQGAPQRVPGSHTGRVDCTTSSATLRAANSNRFKIAFAVTSGTGTVYISKGSVAATKTNSFAIQQTGPVVTWSDGGEGGSVYSGAFQCLAGSGTVTVFYDEVQ
jgi:hypothetical protein